MNWIGRRCGAIRGVVRLAIPILLWCVGPACGSDHLAGEDHGNILTGDAGLVLTEAEHGIGWGKATCTLCHDLNNIHISDRTGTNINVAAIRTITFDQGLASCAACHGANGVP